MGWGPKKAKTEEGPYVPPMGDPGLRGLGGSQGPKVGGRLGWYTCLSVHHVMKSCKKL